VLHGHVVTLLDEAVIRVDVASRPDDWLSSSSMVDARFSFGAEPFLACIEHHSILQVLVARLVHRFGASHFSLPRVLVQARSRHFKLQGLAVENLVVIEARRGGVETDSLPSNGFVIARTLTVLLPYIWVLNARYLILDTEDGILVVNVLSLLALRHNLLSLASAVAQDADSGLLRRVAQAEAIDSGAENRIAHPTLL